MGLRVYGSMNLGFWAYGSMGFLGLSGLTGRLDTRLGVRGQALQQEDRVVPCPF